MLFGGGNPRGIPGVVYTDDGTIGNGLSNEGDTVLLIDEGNSARQVLKLGPNGTVRAVCVGFIDEIDLAPPALKTFGS